MRRIFGTPDKFAFEYTLLDNPYGEQGALGMSWGELKLWVEGNDLCVCTIDGEVYTHTWNLYYVIERLCENIDYMLRYDPYPLPVEGQNTLEKDDVANTYEFEEQAEDIAWYEARNEWFYRHCWAYEGGCRGKASVYFSRHKDFEEIIWNNNPEDVAEFHNQRGVYTVPPAEFRNILISFLLAIIDDVEAKCGSKDKDILDWKKKIRSFVKVMEDDRDNTNKD